MKTKRKHALVIMFFAAVHVALALRADINRDGIVNADDLAILSEEWLMTQQYGNELVTNGGFDSDADWNKGSTWTIADGVAAWAYDLAPNSLYQELAITAGRQYRVAFTLSDLVKDSGHLRVSLGGSAAQIVDTAGAHELTMTAGEANAYLLFDVSIEGEGARLTLDDVSVKQLLPATGILTDVRNWAVARLAAIEEAGLTAFKTVEPWRGQISVLDTAGLAAFDKYTPFAFIHTAFERVDREGGMDADIKLVIEVAVGQADDAPGVCFSGDGEVFGLDRLLELVVCELDHSHPGAGIECDDFFLTDTLPTVLHHKRAAVQLHFEANWIQVIN